MPEDVTINISKGATPPPCPIEGHEWKAVVHNPYVGWLAYWKENINDAIKYVYFSSNSRLRGQSDLKKFEVARALKV
jgi:DNA topoisomerase I